ncbi:hypothetical protein TNCT_402941 [Trichonephila clavata]|uniref:Uncharacterized protein n=1 Tax=Trichonephila clavata TaxID=2740835 RepID=A0A8X6LL00_TRICU|nr:hypothetical protein TNCT_402941 [Trichonephila clavata]
MEKSNASQQCLPLKYDNDDTSIVSEEEQIVLEQRCTQIMICAKSLEGGRRSWLNPYDFMICLELYQSKTHILICHNSCLAFEQKDYKTWKTQPMMYHCSKVEECNCRNGRKVTCSNK